MENEVTRGVWMLSTVDSKLYCVENEVTHCLVWMQSTVDSKL